MFAEKGIGVWFANWEIKAGESITGGIGKGIEECDVFVLLWSAGAKGSRWVETEMRAAIRKRVDDQAFRMVPVMLDSTALPPLLTDYLGFTVRNISDLENIVREICPDESQIDEVVRIQARFLELVANQFPEDDAIRSLICPVCGSRNLTAQIKHEPRFDERLYLVRCADCDWQHQAQGDIGAQSQNSAV